MKIKVLSNKYGNETIDTDTYNSMLVSCSSPIFKMVEEIFNEWFDHNTQPGAPGEIYYKYYGDADQPGIYEKQGAIKQGIENMVELLLETGKNSALVTKAVLNTMDIETAFE